MMRPNRSMTGGCARTTPQRSPADAQALAEHVAQAQLALIAEAAERIVKRMSGVPQSVVISGAGEFLVIDRAGPGPNCDEFQFGDARIELQRPG